MAIFDDEKYDALFMEELFIVNLYGTEEEVERFYRLLSEREKFENTIAIIDLVESIKRRNITGMEWHCCSRCIHFDLCKLNWYRGERNIERKCCTLCQNYKECYKDAKKLEMMMGDKVDENNRNNG